MYHATFKNSVFVQNSSTKEKFQKFPDNYTICHISTLSLWLRKEKTYKIWLIVELLLVEDIILLVYWVECLSMGWETAVQSQVKSYQRLKKWYLISPCLTLSIIWYVSRVKWSNPKKGVVPFPTPQHSSY